MFALPFKSLLPYFSVCFGRHSSWLRSIQISLSLPPPLSSQSEFLWNDCAISVHTRYSCNFHDFIIYNRWFWRCFQQNNKSALSDDSRYEYMSLTVFIELFWLACVDIGNAVWLVDLMFRFDLPHSVGQQDVGGCFLNDTVLDTFVLQMMRRVSVQCEVKPQCNQNSSCRMFNLRSLTCDAVSVAAFVLLHPHYQKDSGLNHFRPLPRPRNPLCVHWNPTIVQIVRKTKCSWWKSFNEKAYINLVLLCRSASFWFILENWLLWNACRCGRHIVRVRMWNVMWRWNRLHFGSCLGYIIHGCWMDDRFSRRRFRRRLHFRMRNMVIGENELSHADKSKLRNSPLRRVCPSCRHRPLYSSPLQTICALSF